MTIEIWAERSEGSNPPEFMGEATSWDEAAKMIREIDSADGWPEAYDAIGYDRAAGVGRLFTHEWEPLGDDWEFPPRP